MRAQLIIENGEGSPRTRALDPGETITLGRSRANTIVLHDEHASRHHARVVWNAERWMIEDLGTLNGTFVNGEKIGDARALAHGQVIGIADMRLRFSTAEAAPSPTPSSTHGDSTGTLFLADDLTGLYQFMTDAAAETDPQAVIEGMLETVTRRTAACLAGFLNLDPEHPVSKMIYPKQAEVNGDLSRFLTQRVKESGKPVWLRGDAAGEESCESLASFVDAVCVPLKSENGPLGALHVYKDRRPFAPREVQFCEVLAGFAAHCLSRLRLFRILAAENSRLRYRSAVSEELVGNNSAMQTLRQTISKAAASDSTVLILGESGVGKELVAHSLHRQSARSGNPFVVANCGAFTETLIDSQLFGHRKGSFTGAVADHAGYFQEADDGTLFLDEIGDLPMEAQVKLLRILEGKPFRPVGGTGDIRVDVRVVTATNRDLDQAVRDKEFRGDLFFRLQVLTIRVPPLREHAEDIGELAEHFLGQLTPPARARKPISAAALRRLKEYHWPGNVRQLRSVLERAVFMGDGPSIEPNDLGFADLPAGDQPASCKMEDVEAWIIAKVLKQVDGNVTQAAQILGLNRETVGKKIQQYGLNKR